MLDGGYTLLDCMSAQPSDHHNGQMIVPLTRKRQYVPGMFACHGERDITAPAEQLRMQRPDTQGLRNQSLFERTRTPVLQERLLMGRGIQKSLALCKSTGRRLSGSTRLKSHSSVPW